MKINSIGLVKQPGKNACWDLYVNDQYVGIYAPASHAFTLKNTPLGVLTECEVSIVGSVYPIIDGPREVLREAVTDIAATGNTTVTETR